MYSRWQAIECSLPAGVAGSLMRLNEAQQRGQEVEASSRAADKRARPWSESPDDTEHTSAKQKRHTATASLRSPGDIRWVEEDLLPGSATNESQTRVKWIREGFIALDERFQRAAAGWSLFPTADILCSEVAEPFVSKPVHLEPERNPTTAAQSGGWPREPVLEMRVSTFERNRLA